MVQAVVVPVEDPLPRGGGERQRRPGPQLQGDPAAAQQCPDGVVRVARGDALEDLVDDPADHQGGGDGGEQAGQRPEHRHLVVGRWGGTGGRHPGIVG
ncbi:hypothetical protein [Kitasatospora sp. NPDC005748]|uniref:hypothetical protein n=1 Tax=Kitasatospora sp. NPDC005748 TaxID=3157063 RepID=UPI0033F61DB9